MNKGSIGGGDGVEIDGMSDMAEIMYMIMTRA